MGLYGTIRPYRTARFTERIDAIGSKRVTSAVEPTDLNVRLTRLVSLVSALCGAGIAALAVAPT